jgi:hypothetical protein
MAEVRLAVAGRLLSTPARERTGITLRHFSTFDPSSLLRGNNDDARPFRKFDGWIERPNHAVLHNTFDGQRSSADAVKVCLQWRGRSALGQLRVFHWGLGRDLFVFGAAVPIDPFESPHASPFQDRAIVQRIE